ncbi:MULTISPECIES: aldo/keto reductase [unclassified Luteococcus]|uniref:aldo/keto reductase n=1 Tax=unclassified Luteococcus TaxID=2639923 RepID=UPI00313BAAA6
MSALPTRTVGPFEVSALGLGCMNLSHAYQPRPAEEVGEALVNQAIDLGVTFLDTAALYGGGRNEELVGRVLRTRRDEVVLASKGVMHLVDGTKVIDGRPESIKQNCEDSLRRLGVDVIDLYYLHRWDKQVPIAESVGAVAQLVEQGKVRAIGLSEVSVDRLGEAQRVHPIAAVQNEYSLWTRNAEIAMLEACERSGIALVAFSPLGRGMLTGAVRDPQLLPTGDIRRPMPRFQPENFGHNLALVDQLAELAREAGCTPAQLALAWLLHRSPSVVPIPGTTSSEHLRENAAATQVRLDEDLARQVDELINQRTVAGSRYQDAQLDEVDAETF